MPKHQRKTDRPFGVSRKTIRKQATQVRIVSGGTRKAIKARTRKEERERKEAEKNAG